MKLSMGALTLSLLFLSACAAQTTPTTLKPQDTETLEIPLGEKAWSFEIPEGCAIQGKGAVANTVQCPKLGQANVAGESAAELGKLVRELTPRTEITVGGAPAKLTTFQATHFIDYDGYAPVERTAHGIVKTHRIKERDRDFANAKPCQDPNQVVLQYDGCPSVGGDADVCGSPTQTCGAPLAAGKPCDHNGACQSKSCGFPSGVCE